MSDHLEAADWRELPTTLPELDDLFGDEPIDFDQEPEPILDADQIDRRLAALHRAEVAADEFQKTAENRRAELEARIALQGQPLAEKVGWIRRSLELSHAALVARDRKKTRVVFPNGTLTSKAGGVEWQYPEPGSPAEAELVEWVKANLPSAYVRPTAPDPRIDKNVLKAAAKTRTLTEGPDRTLVPAWEDGSVVVDDGKTVPGVTVKTKPRTYDPKVSL